MEFVCFIGSDEKNWGQIKALLNRLEYDKAVLVVDKEIMGFPENEKCKVVKVNAGAGLLDLKKEIMEKTKSLLSGDFEVSLSLASGNGKEHMALVGAMLSLPVGVRLVAFTKEGIKWLS
jgi:hypothetical protein